MSDPAWNDQLLQCDPHTVADKRSRVQRMFSAIATSYDLNNRLHSFWRDQAWRRRAVKIAQLKPTDDVVDVACGTGDLSLCFLQRIWDKYGVNDNVPRDAQVVGVDFTYAMLPIARQKADRLDRKDRNRTHQDVSRDNILFINGDATALPLPDESADVVSIAFGIRNVQEPEKALAEFYRILRPGGRVIILEFSEPTNPVLRSLNRFYCGKVMPITATLISRDKSGAYKYLPKSIGTFWTREKMTQMLAAAGFERIEQHPMTFGVCVCYRGVKT